jgi:hypothetical protein
MVLPIYQILDAYRNRAKIFVIILIFALVDFILMNLHL